MKVEVKLKGALRSLFYDGPTPKEFDVQSGKLGDADSCMKKILEGSKTEEAGVDPRGNRMFQIKFSKDPITFIPAEIAILKELFDAKTKWSHEEAPVALELKALFEGK